MNWKLLFIKIVGCYQIIGGVLGIYSTFAGFGNKSFFTFIQSVIFIFPYFILLIIAGVNFFRKQKLKTAFNLTYIVQLIQVIQIKVLELGFYYICGCYFNFGIIDNGKMDFFIDHGLFAVDCVLKLGSAGKGFTLLVNIVPIIIIVLLQSIKPTLVGQKGYEYGMSDKSKTKDVQLTK